MFKRFFSRACVWIADRHTTCASLWNDMAEAALTGTRLAIAEAEPGLPERLKGEKPDGTGIKFIALTTLNCHWPKGDPLEDDFEFCGGRAIEGTPYCAHHCRISYAPAAKPPA